MMLYIRAVESVVNLSCLSICACTIHPFEIGEPKKRQKKNYYTGKTNNIPPVCLDVYRGCFG
jgi:hypothetical protein